MNLNTIHQLHFVGSHSNFSVVTPFPHTAPDPAAQGVPTAQRILEMGFYLSVEGERHL